MKRSGAKGGHVARPYEANFLRGFLRGTSRRDTWHDLMKQISYVDSYVARPGGPLHFYDEYGEESEPLICECLSEYSFLSSCHVKILEIIDYCGTKGEMGQMKKFLEKLPCLELVNIHASAKAKLTFCTDLQVLPRAGNIQLKFFSFQN
uniref:FBD domain-containing protein n=1 Tax=Brassica campestris TaxID=3711 RepID=M4ERQ4_BRACM